MKKIISGALIALMLSASSFAFADTDINNQAIDINSLGYGQSTENAVFDTEKIPYKEFSPTTTENSDSISALASTAPHWTAHSDVSTLGVGSSYSESWTDSSKSKRKNIDHLGARSVVYLNQGYVGTDSDHKYNDSQARSVIDSKSGIAGDVEVYGYHAFDHTGYTSWFPDTYGD